MQRRKHPRLKVGALFCVLDIKMNSSDLVSRQMRQEDVHALLGSPQRGSVTRFSNNERRTATRQARRMPAHLNIGRVKRARLRDHGSVEIANDPKLLGRCQRRAHDSTFGAVDRHSDKSRYLLENYLLRLKLTPKTASCCAKTKAVPTFGWPANGISARGVKIRTRAVFAGSSGGKTNVVSARLNSLAMACI
jgi:hypothetical protein